MQQSMWFDGHKESAWRITQGKGDRKVGGKTEKIQRQRFVWCIQNHDQVGNRPYGERLNEMDSVQLDVYRAVSALLLLSPHTPLLFMGHEWAASTPFLFFRDRKEIDANATPNRLKDIEQARQATDSRPVLDPHDPHSFLKSVLQWEERFNEPRAGVWQLYVDLLRLRRELSILRSLVRECFVVKPFGNNTRAAVERPSSEC